MGNGGSSGGHVLYIPVMFSFIGVTEIARVLRHLWLVYILKLCRIKQNTKLHVLV